MSFPFCPNGSRSECKNYLTKNVLTIAPNNVILCWHWFILLGLARTGPHPPVQKLRWLGHLFCLSSPTVVYFDQHLCTTHSKCWLNYVFSIFLCLKAEKRKKKYEICCKILHKNVFFNLHQNAVQRLFLPFFSFLAQKNIENAYFDWRL